MNIRNILLGASLLAQGLASAQPGGDAADTAATATGGAVVSNPADPNPPLGALPPAPAQAWRHWMVPEIPLGIVSRLRQRYSAKIFIVNPGTSAVTAAVESLDAAGRTTLRTRADIGSRRQATVDYKRGWCRVSAGGPVMVWATKFGSETRFNHANPNPPNANDRFADEVWVYAEHITAHPFPAGDGAAAGRP